MIKNIPFLEPEEPGFSGSIVIETGNMGNDGETIMSWWKEKKYRMIQNNFRDIDAAIDVEKYVQTLKEFHANVCMVGCGGITAFYPTELECQKTSPYLQDDVLERLLAVCHENQIRVIARFDFSKTHLDFLERHPEWYSRSLDKEPVLFHDTAATCVNGPYQQECSLEILEEVIRKYPVDGVFFNMFGYQTYDYSGRYVGICQCESCQKRFFEFSGMQLPVKEDENDPVYIKYQEFKRFTTESLLEKIYRRVKELNKDVAVYTYSSRWVDLVRNESNSAVDRALPFWVMASENNVSGIRGTYEERFSSNCVINAVDIFWRFMGVSPWLNELRLLGEMACGGNLDWCIIGDFEGYPDRKNFAGVKRVFSFHEKYETIFHRLKSVASVLLVVPNRAASAQKEYMGIFKMLKEKHILFDTVYAAEEYVLREKAGDYTVIILPGIQQLEKETCDALENCGALLIGTGLALKEDSDGLKRLFNVSLGERLENVRGSYLLVEPGELFEDFKERDWLYLDREYCCMESGSGNKNYLPLITAGMYGPPERCFGYTVTENASVSVQEGKSVYFSWMPGELYYFHGYEDFKNLFADFLLREGRVKKWLEIQAPACVEVLFDRCGENQYLLQLLNYSGFNGMTFSEPLPVSVEIALCGLEVEKIWMLETGRRRKVSYDNKMKISLDRLYRAFLIIGKER